MKKQFTLIVSLLIMVSFSVSAQYTGTAWKAGGWKFVADNTKNFAGENTIDAWQYDLGTYMPLPTDLTATTVNITAFQNSNFSAGLIKAPNASADETCAATGTRMIWNPATSTTVANVFRRAYLNKRQGDATDRLATASCPIVTEGTTVLAADDPANYTNLANVSAFVMNDMYGRLGASGAALRYSVNFETGKYGLVFKGNGSQVVKVRILKRTAGNSISEVVYDGSASAGAAAQKNQQVTTAASADYGPVTGYEGLIDNMKLYSTGACYFSTQNDMSTGATPGTKLSLSLSGNYVVELISDGTAGAAGAFTFEFLGAVTSVIESGLNNIDVFQSAGSIIIRTNGEKNVSAKIYDISGRLITQTENIEYEKHISFNSAQKGVYMVKLSRSNAVETRKIVIQ